MAKEAKCFKCDKGGLRWGLNRRNQQWELRDIHGFKHVCSPCDLYEKNEREAPQMWERNRRRLMGVMLSNRAIEAGLLDDLNIE